MLDDKELLSFFQTWHSAYYNSSYKFADETVVCSVYNAIVVKMLNTINNDFLKSPSMLDNFLQLRDRSKVDVVRQT